MSRKGENIYKRKDNRWEARYIKGYNPDGTAKFGYCYAKSYRDVKTKLNEAKSALMVGKPNPTTKQKRRFSIYCDEWLQTSRYCVKESTYVKYCSTVEKYIKPHLGGYLVQSISSVIVCEFSHSLLIEDELSPKTVRDILTVLHSIIKYTSRNFTEYMQPIDIVYPKIPKNEIRVLSKEEQTRFVEYLLNDMDECKLGVLLALFTGMRIGEVCALRWSNVLLSEKVIQVDCTMQRLKNIESDSPYKTKIVISDPKSNSSARVIPITDYICKLCKTKLVNSSAAFLLTGEEDRFIEPRTLQYRLEKYTNDCGLDGVHFHTLRHTFATRCVEVDFEIKSLIEILGHSNPRITLERYVHSSLELKRNNMDKLSTIGF